MYLYIFKIGGLYMNLLDKELEKIRNLRNILLNTTDFYIKNKENDKIYALMPNYTVPLINKVDLYLIFEISVYSTAMELTSYISVNELRSSDDCRFGQYNIVIADILSQLTNKSSNNDRNIFLDLTKNNYVFNRPSDHVISLINRFNIDNEIKNMKKIWNIPSNKISMSFKLPKDNLLCNFLILDEQLLQLTKSNNDSGTDIKIYVATPFEKSKFITIYNSDV